MELHRLPLPPLGANCYLIQNGPQGLVIDPGGDAQLVGRACRELGMTPTAFLLTHGHFDHVGALSELLDAWPDAPVYCHDADLAETDEELFPLDKQLGDHPHHPLADGQLLELAGLQIEVLHTPGHSKGSCCFRVGDALFTGDTLFRFSMGRTDFPGGDDREMAASLQRLAALEDDLNVYPGHDAPTTLSAERAHNPYLKGAAE